MRKNDRFRLAVRDDGVQELLGELSEMRVALANAYLRFNTTTEPELVDACVYEINAAQSRCNYLLRAIKERGGELAAFRTDGEGAAWV